MRLTGLHLNNFRSFTSFSASLDPTSVIIGNNGTGKSTLIEAIRLLSVGKSFRTNRMDEAIRFDEPYFRLRVELESDKAKTVELFYGQAFAEQPVRDRQLTVDSKQKSWLDFVGVLPSVMFVPSDIEIVIGSPQVRRRYIDGILWQISPEFREQYLRLGKILKERAASLFLIKINRASLAELEPWNELLREVTEYIREERQKYLEAVGLELNKKNHRINDFSVKLQYQTGSKSLESVVDQEIKTAQNLFGPHRDEIEIELNDRSARRYASRGQSRTLVMLLKIIEAGYLAEKLSTDPIILLDDILSELDEGNSEFLIEHLPARSQRLATSIQPQTIFKDWSEIVLA